MRRFTFEIEGKSGDTFDIYLSIHSGRGIVYGTWSCLPGYLPSVLGFYRYNTPGAFLGLYDRDRSTLEGLSYYLGGDDSITLYALLRFKELIFEPKKGMKGKGSIFEYGAAGEQVLKRDMWSGGFVDSTIKWRITAAE